MHLLSRERRIKAITTISILRLLVRSVQVAVAAAQTKRRLFFFFSFFLFFFLQQPTEIRGEKQQAGK